MNPFRSIKGRLLIFGLCISLIPITIITTIYYFKARSVVKQQTLDWLTAVAESRKAHIVEFMDAEKRHITHLGSDFFILDTISRINNEPFSRQDSARVLSNHLSQNKELLGPHINAIEVIDAAGITIASTNELMVGRNIAEYEPLAQNIDKIYHEPYVSTPHHHLGHKTPESIDISVPIVTRVGGKPLGLLVSHYSLDVLNEITSNRAGMGETGEVYLVGSDGKMLTESRFMEGAPLKVEVDTEPVRRVAEGGGEMTGIYPDYRGVPIVGASMYLPEYGWTLLAEIDKAEAFAPLRLLGLVAIILGSVCAVVVTVVGIIFAFSTARPINALRDATDKFASGDLKSRANIKRKDEIGRLANSFNAMAGELDTLTESLERRVVERTEELVSEIAERKKAEEQLRESEQDFKNIFENATDGIVAGTLEGNLMDFNDAFLELTGYTRDELLNMRYQDLTPPEYHDMEAEKVSRLLETGEPQEYEKEYLRKDGTRIPLLLKVSTICDIEGKPRLLMAVVKDMTRIKQADEELRQSQENLALAQRISHVGSWEWDIINNTTLYSDETYRLFGLKPQQYKMTYEDFLKFIHTDDRELVKKSVTASIYDAKPYSLDFRIVQPDGTVRIIHSKATVTFDEGGKPLRMNGMVQDITERKQAEEQIKASLAEKEELLKEIHHRVKNNLQIISSLLDMSRMQTDNEEANRLLAEACSRVGTMALIHSQLYRTDRFDRIDMDRHLRETTNSLLQLYGQKKNITIDIKASGVYMPVSQAIPTALALNELISNALEHAYKDREEGTLEISMQKAADDTVSIRVKDDGIGIPEGIDPYKSDSLGLKLVRNLVQRQLKGELRYEVSKGTEFIIEFKVSREDGKEV